MAETPDYYSKYSNYGNSGSSKQVSSSRKYGSSSTVMHASAQLAPFSGTQFTCFTGTQVQILTLTQQTRIWRRRRTHLHLSHTLEEEEEEEEEEAEALLATPPLGERSAAQQSQTCSSATLQRCSASWSMPQRASGRLCLRRTLPYALSLMPEPDA